MFQVDRQQFISWTNGELVNIKNGAGIIVNEKKCEEAEFRLNNGEEIFLTINKQVVSKMYFDGTEKVFKEELIKTA